MVFGVVLIIVVDKTLGRSDGGRLRDGGAGGGGLDLCRERGVSMWL